MCGGHWRMNIFSNPNFSRNVSRTKIVTVYGALATSVDWNDNLKNQNSDFFVNTATNAKADLENLFIGAGDVESAIIEITGFEEVNSIRKRRQVNGLSSNGSSSKAMVYYEAALTVPESKTTEEIENSVASAVQNADPTQFTSFDSFDSFSVIVEETNQETTPATTTAGTTAAGTTAAGTTAAGTTVAETSSSTTILTEAKSVLILSTNRATNRPLLVDFQGEREKFSNFLEIHEV